MRPHAMYAAVVGALLLVWLGSANAESLSQPVALTLLVSSALLVATVVATYQWRTPLLVVPTAVLSGLVLGLGLAVMLTDPTIALSVSAVPFAMGGLGAVWASHRRNVPSEDAAAGRRALEGAPTA